MFLSSQKLGWATQDVTGVIKEVTEGGGAQETPLFDEGIMTL